MAAQSSVIDLRLEALRSTLADLPEVTKDWPSMDSVERDSWAMDWNQVVGAYLAEVDAAKEAGQLSPSQEEQLAVVLRELRRSIPLIDQLGLYRPPLPTKARALS